MTQDVVITGKGCILPAAIGAGAFGDVLFGSAARPEGPASRKIETLAEESKKRLPALIRRRMSRLSVMVALSCGEAFPSAGVDVEAGKEDIGFAFGTGYGELNTTSRIFIAGIGEHMSPTHFHNSVHNVPLGYAGIITGIKGPSLTFSDGHVSGESAIIRAAMMIRGGMIDVLAAGGGDERYDFPLFDDPGQGGDPGEGSGFLVVESGRSAEGRKRSPLCAISGCSKRSFGGDPGDVASRVECVGASISEALEAAGSDAQPAVFTHLRGEGREDDIIMESLQRVFGRNVPLWSSKGLCGAFTATGALRSVAAVLSIEKGMLPVDTVHPEGPGKSARNILVLGMDPEGDAASIVFSGP
ncbi:MAG: beta-ketoacyl synthase chain length factor [Pseudomonadota bacterium]